MTRGNVAEKMRLHPVDYLLESNDTNESITELSLNELYPFKDHPFRVVDDESMKALAESIQENGVTQPIVVRPRLEGGYEIISGHRRKFASELVGKTTILAIIKDCDDAAAITEMVDSNIHRETLLPSEKAFAYKMKLEAMKRKAGRPNKNDSQVGNHLPSPKSSEILADKTETSKTQIYRLLRLTELIKPLLDMVDNKKLSIVSAEHLSYLDKEFQKLTLDFMEREQKSLSPSQALKLKIEFQKNELTEETLLLLLEDKKEEPCKVTLKGNQLKRYFPKNYTPKQIQDTIIGLLEKWHEGQKK